MSGMTTTTSSADPQSSAGAIATFDLVVLDTPEPRALADFYCALWAGGSFEKKTTG
jgi:hypothetical protein